VATVAVGKATDYQQRAQESLREKTVVKDSVSSRFCVSSLSAPYGYPARALHRDCDRICESDCTCECARVCERSDGGFQANPNRKRGHKATISSQRLKSVKAAVNSFKMVGKEKRRLPKA
jgi:hypothetical protein